MKILIILIDLINSHIIDICKYTYVKSLLKMKIFSSY